MHHAEQADNKLNMHAVLVWLNCACRSTIYLSFCEFSTNKILVCMGHVHALFKGDCSGNHALHSPRSATAPHM